MVHYNNIDGMTGWCQEISGPARDVKEYTDSMKSMGGTYAHPLPGNCPHRGSCTNSMGLEMCTWMGGASDEDIARVHQDFAAMWGGAGHNVAHVIKGHDGKKYCMQVTSPKVADDASWREKGNHWAKRHGVSIQDGKCPARFSEALHRMYHGKTHVIVFGI